MQCGIWSTPNYHPRDSSSYSSVSPNAALAREQPTAIVFSADAESMSEGFTSYEVVKIQENIRINVEAYHNVQSH